MSTVRLLPALITAVTFACSGEDGPACKKDSDCPAYQKCFENECQPRCPCGIEDECTATAPECAAEVWTEVTQDVNQCIPCTFQSDCNDNNKCTKDLCLDGCCAVQVYSPSEAAGCCSTVADCLDKTNPLATPSDPDGDPCTVDSCRSYQCQHEVLDPFCCHKASDCTDENDCTIDSCIDNKCMFSQPIPNCCSSDKQCQNDDPCTMDICLAGVCVHPQNTLNPLCTCLSNLDCDDNNPCTIDSCLDNKCSYDKASSSLCCGATAQCDDQDPTTDDYCKMYTCIHVKHKTCTSDDMCKDTDACTIDACVDGFCIHEHTDDPYCCNYDTDCNDNNNVCKYKILMNPGCCKTASDCDDGIGCTIDECTDWMCKHTPVGAKCCTPETAGVVCNDGNPCTIDKCENGLCEWQVVTAGCCTMDQDCMDCVSTSTGASCNVDHTVFPPKCKGEGCIDNLCTIHKCVDQMCYYTSVPSCCLTNKDCLDSNPCTTDICGPDNKCKNTMDPACCGNNNMCNDGNVCTKDICYIPPGQEKGTCKHEVIEDCCSSAAECPVKTCKTAYCQNGNCVYVQQPNCCIHDEDCNDGDVCTIDKCQNSQCKHIPSGLCG